MNCLVVGEIQVIGAERLDKALRNSPLTLRIHHLTLQTLSSSRPFSGFAETSDGEILIRLQPAASPHALMQ